MYFSPLLRHKAQRGFRAPVREVVPISAQIFKPTQRFAQNVAEAEPPVATDVPISPCAPFKPM
jgi:hypothetical protein